ncbi:MAG: hypothetical protein GQ544_03565 [Candidatus Aminicenantes bacterium]|nr:hypothetical protein [Candidatus Aminicenantes bacterium]
MKNEIAIEKIPKLDLEGSAVIRYIQSYVPEATAAYLLKGEYRIKYLKYDWSLNEKQQP